MQIARKLLPLLVFVASLQVHAGSKKKPVVVPPDVLARIRGAHTIFVSNAGEDITLTENTNYPTNGTYRDVYQALAGWPGVQLIDTPAHADLVVQVSGTATVEDDGWSFPNKNDRSGHEILDYPETLHLRVLDSGTQQVLWNYDVLVTHAALTKDVKDLLAPIEPTSAPHPVNKPVLLPGQLKNPTKLFVQLAPLPANSDVSAASAVDTAVSQALLKLGKYQMVDSASEADIVLVLDVEANQPGQGLHYMGIKVLDPNSKTILWNFIVPFITHWNARTSQQQISGTIPYFLKYWDGVIGKGHV
jgi:fructose-specific component phosphotransferase system IIB-like protein